MATIVFDGQQTDERVLYTVRPHPFAKRLAIARVVVLAFFFFLVFLLISTIVPAVSSSLRIAGALTSLVLLSVGVWWNHVSFTRDKTFITDRRIIRFDTVSPFFQTKRALFWNEALKAKGYSPNLLFRFLKIGSVEVEPLLGEKENVIVTDVYYFEDLANYIDKILFTFKNKPADIDTIMPFVPKPRGERRA